MSVWRTRGDGHEAVGGDVGEEVAEEGAVGGACAVSPDEDWKGYILWRGIGHVDRVFGEGGVC